MGCDFEREPHKERCREEAEPTVINVRAAAERNKAFRKEIWTGENLQMTLMSISPCKDIGWEIHNDTDQCIRVESGTALLKIRKCRGFSECEKELEVSDTAFIPEGTWHNIVNTGRCPLKLSSIYAPPHHERRTRQETREDAEC